LYLKIFIFFHAFLHRIRKGTKQMRVFFYIYNPAFSPENQFYFTMKYFEPDKIYEKEILPNVYIIVILPYDPFGKNRMVYTVKNQCVEDTSIDYNDGAVKLFLYTRGTEGNPSQNLIDMLKYIEESTEQNIVNQDIQTIHTMVKHMKQKKEVDIHYMKSWEWEEYIREKATKEGKEKGIKEGRIEGIKEQQKETEQQRKRAEKAEAEVMRLRKALEKLQE